MIKLMALILICLTINIANADAASKCSKTLLKKLDKCQKYSCKMRRPLMSSFTIVHTIKGKNQAGKCLYSQTMPNGGLMTCKASNKTMNAFSISAKDLIEGNFSFGGSAQKKPGQIALDKALNNGKCIISGY